MYHPSEQTRHSGCPPACPGDAGQENRNQVTGVVIERTVDGKPRQISLSCAILIDATEYGDVIPLTGAAYRIGNLAGGSVDQNDAHSVPPLRDNTGQRLNNI